MYEECLKQLEFISQAVGNRVDYVQGGGGNTSVKLDSALMAVKASGFKLKQITPTEGYVVVNYKNIKDYYNDVDLSSDTDFEKESVEFVKSNIVEMEGLKKVRPSVEAGFHSILKKYVIHTHPVYGNVLCCSKNGESVIAKVFGEKDYAVAWVPYINPGFCLSLKIKETVEKCINERGMFPEVIFMENHGLIVNCDTSTRCVELHDEVNGLIKEHLKIGGNFPGIELAQIDEATFVSKTQYLIDFFNKTEIGYGYFDNVLYPDQLVYLNGAFSINGSDKKLNINTSTGELVYKASYQEALTLEETLLAFVYVMTEVEKCGLDLKVMSEREVDFINNWESEAYRKSLVKDLAK